MVLKEVGPFLQRLTHRLCPIPVVPYSRDVLHEIAVHRNSGKNQRERREGTHREETERKNIHSSKVRARVANRAHTRIPGVLYTLLDLTPYRKRACSHVPKRVCE